MHLFWWITACRCFCSFQHVSHTSPEQSQPIFLWLISQAPPDLMVFNSLLRFSMTFKSGFYACKLITFTLVSGDYRLLLFYKIKPQPTPSFAADCLGFLSPWRSCRHTEASPQHDTSTTVFYCWIVFLILSFNFILQALGIILLLCANRTKCFSYL